MKRVWGKNYRLTMTGEDVVQQNLAKIAIFHREKFQKALADEGKDIYDESQNEVPFDTGALKESGNVKSGLDREGDENSYVVAIGYGGKNKNPVNKAPTSRYARYQHETNPSKAKYLENPFMRALANMAGRIATKVKGM